MREEVRAVDFPTARSVGALLGHAEFGGSRFERDFLDRR